MNLYDRDFRLSDRLTTRVQAAPDAIIDATIRCVAKPLAERLDVLDLVAPKKSFAARAEGQNLWSYVMAKQPGMTCFEQPENEYLAQYMDGDFAIVGAKKPGRTPGY